MTEAQSNGQRGEDTVDAVIVGAGFAGLYSLYQLRQRGYTTRVFERGDGVGGTWYWNRYPGARCDVESMEYSYSFSEDLEQEWEWTERYPAQPEILKYINHVADRFDLRKDVTFNTLVTDASYNDDTKLWEITTDDGKVTKALYFVSAVGCLSSKLDPPFKGLDSFKGEWYQTSDWPHEDEPDFTGKRVGIVGTGSTGIQAIPQLAKRSKHLTVFQRTPNYSIPAQNGPLSEEFIKDMKGRYRAHRQAAKESAFGVPVEPNMKSALEVTPEEQKAELDWRWEYGGGATILLSFSDLLVNEEANEVGAEYVRNKIREIVKDPEKAQALLPFDHPIGTKRICVDIDYYDTFNRDNVDIVNVREAPIAEITPNGIKLENGQEFELDAIVFAIGFDAMTGPLFDMNVKGRNGQLLKDVWADGPKTYLGLMMHDFPNLFVITGPGSPSVLSNMVVSIEQHVDFIVDALEYMKERGLHTIEPTLDAQEKWTQHCTDIGNSTLFPRANSWYTGANVPGKVRVFTPYVGGVGPYRETCNQIAAKDYEGFEFDGDDHPLGDPNTEFAAHEPSIATDTSP